MIEFDPQEVGDGVQPVDLHFIKHDPDHTALWGSYGWACHKDNLSTKREGFSLWFLSLIIGDDSGGI